MSKYTVTGIVVGVFVAVAVLVVLAQNMLFGPRRPEHNAMLLYAPVDFAGTTVMTSDTLAFSCRDPYFKTPEPKWQAGDIIEIRASGAGGFDRVFRARSSDRISPNGYRMLAKDWKGPGGGGTFPMKNAAIAALIGAFGVVEYDEMRVPHVRGTPFFFIGEEAYVRVPDDVEPKLHLALNEQWIRPAWEDNWGSFTVILTVHRPS
jgi:hypothetical protein